jgi:hypothetical protein
MKVFIFVGDVGWDIFINMLERRAAFMVAEMVAQGVAKAEHFQASKGRQRHRHGYLRRSRVLRARGPATGDMKVNEIERVTYHHWNDLGFFNPIW